MVSGEDSGISSIVVLPGRAREDVPILHVAQNSATKTQSYTVAPRWQART